MELVRAVVVVTHLKVEWSGKEGRNRNLSSRANERASQSSLFLPIIIICIELIRKEASAKYDYLAELALNGSTTS